MAGGTLQPPLIVIEFAKVLIDLIAQVENELERQRQRAIGTARSILVALLSGLVVLMGIVWLSYAAYSLLGVQLQPPAAALITGAILLGLGGIGLALSRRSG